MIADIVRGLLLLALYTVLVLLVAAAITVGHGPATLDEPAHPPLGGEPAGPDVDLLADQPVECFSDQEVRRRFDVIMRDGF